MDRTGLVIAAGGASRRFGGGSKLFQELGGMPVFMHSVVNLRDACDCCVIVVPGHDKASFEQALESCRIGGVQVVCGGAERSDSVLAGLKALPADVKYAAIHDAARPLASAALLLRCMEAARMNGAAIAAHRVTDTIKVADGGMHVIDTPDRDTLWAAETPQVFLREWLEEAYERCRLSGLHVTDDAQAVKSLGHDVLLVENTSCNIKITSRDDLALARALVK